MPLLRTLLLAALVTATAIGCGGESAVTNPLVDTMSATIRGSRWTSIHAFVVDTSGILAFTAGIAPPWTSDVIIIEIPRVTAPGTFTLGGPGTTGAQAQYRSPGNVTYSTTPHSPAPTGTMTITTIGNGHISGTFSFTGYAGANFPSTDSLVITDGTFNVLY